MALYWTATSGPAGQEVSLLSPGQQPLRVRADALNPADLTFPAPGGGLLRVPVGGGAPLPVNGASNGQLWYYDANAGLWVTSLAPADKQVARWNAALNRYDMLALDSSNVANVSSVPGATVSAALDSLASGGGGGGSDPAVIEYREHMLYANRTSTMIVTLGTGGSLQPPVPAAGHPGVITNRFTSATTGSASLFEFTGYDTVTASLHPYFVTNMRCIIRRTSLTGTRWAFGIAGASRVAGVLGTPPVLGSDWCINLATLDTGNWLAVTRATAAGVITQTDLGFAPVSGNWYRWEIVLTLPTKAEFYLDGVLVHTATASLPSLADITASGFGIVAMNNSRPAVGAGIDRLLDIDEVYYRCLVS